MNPNSYHYQKPNDGFCVVYNNDFSKNGLEEFLEESTFHFFEMSTDRNGKPMFKMKRLDPSTGRIGKGGLVVCADATMEGYVSSRVDHYRIRDPEVEKILAMRRAYSAQSNQSVVDLNQPPPPTRFEPQPVPEPQPEPQEELDIAQLAAANGYLYALSQDGRLYSYSDEESGFIEMPRTIKKGK